MASAARAGNVHGRISRFSVLDRWVSGASLCSPFSYFRFGVPETGSITTETGSQSRTSCVERDVGVNCQGRDPSELAERLGQALKDEAELNTAVSRLMKARQDK